MIFNAVRMLTCMYMDMAMPMPKLCRAHLLPAAGYEDVFDQSI